MRQNVKQNLVLHEDSMQRLQQEFDKYRGIFISRIVRVECTLGYTHAPDRKTDWARGRAANRSSGMGNFVYPQLGPMPVSRADLPRPRAGPPPRCHRCPMTRRSDKEPHGGRLPRGSSPCRCAWERAQRAPSFFSCSDGFMIYACSMCKAYKCVFETRSGQTTSIYARST
ncbi:unnamed protein product [Prorocentrum cordatum]|uniref:Uncharacterized protein n=1 Tax=Prorocentrum cordatum TaxID=2364126 RepID=A0ABN9PI80_9DINO|nr:unnamed protein product [Polarella glacialis]